MSVCGCRTPKGENEVLNPFGADARVLFNTFTQENDLRKKKRLLTGIVMVFIMFLTLCVSHSSGLLFILSVVFAWGKEGGEQTSPNANVWVGTAT